MRMPPQEVSADAKEVMSNYQKEKAKKYGMNYIEPTQPRWFVSYPYMIAIMAVLQVMVVIYGAKFFNFFGFTVSAGWLILLPIMMYIFQIVSECYGWQYARQIIWANFLVNGLTTLIVFSFKYIQFYDPTNAHKDMGLAYAVLMDNKWVACVTMWVGVFLSDLITSALMSWSRFHWNGRFVFLRMIILHLVSECIMLSGSFIVLPFRGYSITETWHLNYDSLIARTIVSLALVPIARFVSWYIQHRIEGVVVFDYKQEFSPFKFGINPNDSVQFNATGWDRVDSGKVNLKKMAEHYNQEILQEQHQKQLDEFNNRNHKV